MAVLAALGDIRGCSCSSTARIRCGPSATRSFYVFGNAYGFSELFVRMSPLLLTSVAVAAPARLGLINVGGEGQLYMGGLFATAGALGFADWPAVALLPLMTALGFLGGALWALLPGLLRAAKLVNETISTLLLNYVAPLIVSFFIFGPWRSSESASYPQSPAFVAAARLPTLDGTRVHLGLLYGLVCLCVYGFVVGRTRWGLEMRAIGGNAEASLRLGIPVSAYMIVSMASAGGVAGLAGMAEVSAIQGRLVAQLSPGYGFMGFLVAWLAGGSAVGILADGRSVRRPQLSRRHPADHPGRAVFGDQSADGGDPVHRARRSAGQGARDERGLSRSRCCRARSFRERRCSTPRSANWSANAPESSISASRASC